MGLTPGQQMFVAGTQFTASPTQMISCTTPSAVPHNIAPRLKLSPQRSWDKSQRTITAPNPTANPMFNTPSTPSPPPPESPIPQYTTNLLNTDTPTTLHPRHLTLGSINVQGGLTNGFFHSLCEQAALNSLDIVGVENQCITTTHQIPFIQRQQQHPQLQGYMGVINHTIQRQWRGITYTQKMAQIQTGSNR